MRNLTLALLASLLMLPLLSATSQAHHGPPHHAAHHQHARQPAPRWRRPQVHQRQVDAQRRAAYPKYYYGFHERYFQSLGYPTGDIGLRGQASWPW